MSITAAMAKTPGQTDVYAFGCAACLGDTVVYLSAIQSLDGATVDSKTKFLNDREDYARQMENALQEVYGKHYTCALIFSFQRSRLEKKYVKLRRLYKKKNIRIEELPANVFRFVPVATP